MNSLRLETLESRIVLSANDLGLISGFVYDDLNQDGNVDAGEAIPGALVDLRFDTNGNGSFDADDELRGTETTDSNGQYAFSGLTSGSYFAVQRSQLVDGKNLPEVSSDLITTSGMISGLTIDSFNSPTGPIADVSNDMTSATGSFASTASLGGELDYSIDLVEVSGADTGSVAVSTDNGDLLISSAANSRGAFELTWDGLDGDGGSNANALNGVDLTELAGSFGQGICITGFVPSTPFTSLELTVESADGGTSSASLLSSTTGSGNDFYVPFSGLNDDGVGFTQQTNGGADFTNVSSIVLEIQATTFGLNASLDSIGVVGGSSSTGTNFANVLGSGDLGFSVLVNGISPGIGDPPEFIENANAVHTYFVMNPGTLGVTNVVVTDDAGTPDDLTDDFSPEIVGGDTNSNGVLDPTETWFYRSSRTIVPGLYSAVVTVTGNDGPNALMDSAETSHIGVERSAFFGWHNPDLAADINDDGSISPLDALTLINELTDRTYSDEESSLLEEFDPAADALFDVNNDGYASPLDAVLAVRALGSTLDSPVLDLNGGEVDGINSNVTLESGEFFVALAPNAEISNLSRSVLTSMTVTLLNPVDGDIESLHSSVGNSAIEFIFRTSEQTGDGTARLSLVGYERMEAYMDVLNSLNYGSGSDSPSPVDRIIQVVVNDGFSESQLAQITVQIATE